MGNGDGTFQGETSLNTGVITLSVVAVDLNGDGNLDLVTTDSADNAANVFLANGDGTFQAKTSFATEASSLSAVTASDLNGDGVIDLVTANFGSNTVNVLLGNGIQKTELTPLIDVSVATQATALSAQEQIGDYFDELNTVSGSIGVGLSRLEVAAANLQTTVEGTKAAESRITDVDIAEESARLVSTRILQEAASGVLAHALKGPELALRLLQAE